MSGPGKPKPRPKKGISPSSPPKGIAAGFTRRSERTVTMLGATRATTSA
jgi:hypothetical protein